VTAQSTNSLAVNDATKSVKAQLAITSTDVKILNGLVTKQLKGQTGLLGAWKNAKRVHVVAVANPATPAPVPATPAPVPATPAAPAAQEAPHAAAA